VVWLVEIFKKQIGIHLTSYNYDRLLSTQLQQGCLSRPAANFRRVSRGSLRAIQTVPFGSSRALKTGTCGRFPIFRKIGREGDDNQKGVGVNGST
jgi:hypothetical protein